MVRPVTMRRVLPIVLYFLFLGALSLRFYAKPLYDIDMLGYIGNALLNGEHDPVRVHQRVYQEVDKLPPVVQEHFKGIQADADASQNASRRDRAVNAYHFAEFLPFFAIRPMYNDLIWLLNKAGVGLVQAVVLVSVVSYFLLGTLLFVWVQTLVGNVWAALLASVVMLTPAVMQVGRFTGADGISTLFALFSLYLIFEKRFWVVGTAVLLLSIYIRTDNVALAAPVLLVGVWQKRIAFWKGAVLLAVAVGSVLLINHFAGDYGIRMLYYRNFIGTPIAPAEVKEAFTISDYLRAFRAGISDALNSSLIPFMVVGIIGFLASSRLRVLGAVTIVYSVLHFIILPNWQERWFVILYLVLSIIGINAVAGSKYSNGALGERSGFGDGRGVSET
jgi:hypothetical protein